MTAPQYRIYGVAAGSPLPTLSSADAALIGKTFSLMHGEFTSGQQSALRAANSNLELVNYMNSTYTRFQNDGAELTEAEGTKTAIAMTRAGKLKLASGNLGMLSTTFPVQEAVSGEGIKILGSTATGDYSATSGTGTFVFWIAIDNELMRVTSFTPTETGYVFDPDHPKGPSTGSVTVTRGYAGTSAAQHAGQSALIFSPLYIGQSDQTAEATVGNFPNGEGTGLRYCLDPHSAAGNTFKALQVLSRMTAGFDGGWLDTCNEGNFNLCDTFGNDAKAWDWQNLLSGGRVQYSEVQFRDAQDAKMNFIQDYVHDHTTPARYPVIIDNKLNANNLTDPVKVAEEYMMAKLLVPTSAKPLPVDGYCMEDFITGTNTTTANFNLKLKALRVGITEDMAVMPCLSHAGAASIDQDEPLTANGGRLAFENYGFAYYLLSVTKNRGNDPTMFGTYSIYRTDSGSTTTYPRYWDVHQQYYWPIGYPLNELNAPPSVAADVSLDYPSGITGLYRRDFENAIVLVNSTSTATGTLSLNGTFIDPSLTTEYEGTPVNSVSVGGFGAKILLRQPKMPPTGWLPATVSTASGATGAGTLSGSTFTLTSNGDGMIDGSDSFQFLYKKMSGDCTIIAKIATIGSSNGSTSACAGIMIREKLAGDERNDGAGTATTPGLGNRFVFLGRQNQSSPALIRIYRQITTGATPFNSTLSVSSPYYVKLVRSGDTISRWTSTTGLANSWTSAGNITVSGMSSEVYVGLAAANGSTAGTCTGTFTSVSITSP